MTTVSINKIEVHNFDLWNYWNSRWDLAGVIDPDVCMKIETVATVNGHNLGIEGTRNMLSTAKHCGCQNAFGECIPCTIKDLISESRYSELAESKSFAMALRAA